MMQRSQIQVELLGSTALRVLMIWKGRAVIKESSY